MGDIIIPKRYILGNGENPMKIERITIDNIGGIKHLTLDFNMGLNLICGTNGVGKSTILRSIAQCFLCGENNYIKKYYNSEKGEIHVYLEGNMEKDFITEDFDMIETNNLSYLDINFESTGASNYILFFPSTRTSEYKKIDMLPSIDSKGHSDISSAMSLNEGVTDNIKSWFINRFIFSQINNSLNQYQVNNFKLCKDVFELLDEKLSVKTITPDFEILMNDKDNEIFFEMLSDGYRSCIFILLGIIKEIEYRFPEINVADFDGVIMIDEIEMHLHPQWQAKLVRVLEQIFPNTQIIITTHSPSVLQNAKAEEIIPLYKDERNDIHIKELHLSEYGLQGWTLEEIMKDVMGMPSTTSDLYTEIIQNFNKAMNEENQDDILKYYDILKTMLHPRSTALQLLEIQVSEWKK